MSHKSARKTTPSGKSTRGSSPCQQQTNDLLEEQRKEIDVLKSQVQALNNSVTSLKYDLRIVNTRLDVSSHVNSVLQKQVVDLQQYSRRSTILLENVPTKRNESTEDVETEVKTILIKNYKVDATCLKNEFDKAHRIGKIKEDNNQTIIIRFKSHSFRPKLYVDRKNHQSQRNNNYKLRVDLTSSRRKLLAEVQDKVKDNKKSSVCFCQC